MSHGGPLTTSFRARDLAQAASEFRRAVGRQPPLLRFVLVSLSYLILAKAGLALASLHPSASPVWPPSGLALAAFLLWGNSIWTAIAVGAFIANASTFGSVVTSAAIATGNTLEALVTATLVSRWVSRDDPFVTPSQVAIFACLTLAPGSMISATIGVASLAMANLADIARIPDIWLTWWLGDVGGQLIVTPVMFLWVKHGRETAADLDPPRLFLWLATMVVGTVAFSPLFHDSVMRGSLAFLAIGPLLWAALRCDQRVTATVALVLGAFAIWGAAKGVGPFARAYQNESFLLSLAFVVSTAVPSLILSADVAARRISENHYRAVVEQANDIIATLDLQFRFTSINPALQRILGYEPTDIIGKPLANFIPVDQLPKHKEMLERKLHGQASTQYEMQLLPKDGQDRFTLEVSSTLILDAGGQPLGIHAIARNITERKEAEQRQMTLLRELQHRTRNMLAVVQAIATRTLSSSQNPEEALKTLTGRLHALAHAQEFVTVGPSAGVSFQMLVKRVLETLAGRAVIDGQDRMVAGAFAQTFALVLHELATNASKYGALSAPSGRIMIKWHIERSGEDECLRFEWIERGGPKPREPTQMGLGMLLVSAVGKQHIAFAETGFECVLMIPLAELGRADPAAAWSPGGESETAR